MRPEVEALVALGPFPAELGASVERVRGHELAYRAIRRPVTDDEASVLLTILGPDDCFGLAWSLVHLVETAPNWPPPQWPSALPREWRTVLEARIGKAP